MFFTIVSYILAFALGGAVGATIVSRQSIREAEKMEKRYKQSTKMLNDLLDTSMKTSKYFENRCEQLEAEKKLKEGATKYGIDVQ